MKKLSYFALMALLSTNLVAMAQEAPPSLPSFTLPTTTAPPPAPTTTTNPAPTTTTTPTSTTQPQSTQQPQSTPTGSTSFDLGDLDDFGSGSSSGTQGSGSFAAPINFGAYPQQQSYQSSPTFSGSMLQGNALGARGYTATAAPRQVAQTGPGALAALIPVAGYTLMTFRRREQ